MAGAAGSLSVGFWDHWVPGANTAMMQICEEWAEKEKVNLTIEPWGRWGLAHADKLRPPGGPATCGPRFPGNGRGGDTRHCAGAQLH
jgi:hypothetical protein